MDPRPNTASAGGDGAPPAAPNAPARTGYPGTRWLRRVTTHQWTALGALAAVGALLVSLFQFLPSTEATKSVPLLDPCVVRLDGSVDGSAVRCTGGTLDISASPKDGWTGRISRLDVGRMEDQSLLGPLRDGPVIPVGMH